MKVSIVIPVYYNEENLRPLYEDIKRKVIDKIDYECEFACCPLTTVLSEP